MTHTVFDLLTPFHKHAAVIHTHTHRYFQTLSLLRRKARRWCRHSEGLFFDAFRAFGTEKCYSAIG